MSFEGYFELFVNDNVRDVVNNQLTANGSERDCNAVANCNC
jgi:hypothetical protein